jgi:hypothetical protein
VGDRTYRVQAINKSLIDANMRTILSIANEERKKRKERRKITQFDVRQGK